MAKNKIKIWIMVISLIIIIFGLYLFLGKKVFPTGIFILEPDYQYYSISDIPIRCPSPTPTDSGGLPSGTILSGVIKKCDFPKWNAYTNGFIGSDGKITDVQK